MGRGEVLADHACRHGDHPVTHVLRYRRDSVVVRRVPLELVPAFSEGDSVRGVVKEFSMKSRLRLLHFVRNCNADFVSMLTLTYPRVFSTDGKAVKNHLHRFLDKGLLAFYPCRYVWFLEFQRRGAPHYHILTDRSLEPCQSAFYRGRRGWVKVWTNRVMQDRLREVWYRIVGSGDERHLRAGLMWERIEHEEGALRYTATHAGKEVQKLVPSAFQNVGRFWGHSRDCFVAAPDSIEMTTAEVFEAVGVDALSSRGRVRKFLWDFKPNVVEPF